MERGCIIFKCLKRRGYYCCMDCRERDSCKSSCKNQPEKCLLVRDHVPGPKEVKEYADSRKDGKAV